MFCQRNNYVANVTINLIYHAGIFFCNHRKLELFESAIIVLDHEQEYYSGVSFCFYKDLSSHYYDLCVYTVYGHVLLARTYKYLLYTRHR